MIQCSNCNTTMTESEELIFCPKCGSSFTKEFIREAYEKLFIKGMSMPAEEYKPVEVLRKQKKVLLSAKDSIRKP